MNDWASRWQVDVPDGGPPQVSLARTTHLAVAAHQDDLEIMAYSAIVDCFDDRGFTGIVLTSGGGSPRAGPYAHTSDAHMRAIRAQEQQVAARIGRYALLAQRGLESADLKGGRDHAAVAGDLADILRAARPDVVLLHSPADRHDTHAAAFRLGLAAVRAALADHRPRQLLGCEVWGSLDWLPASARVELPTSARPHLAAALLGVFDSQIAGGKRYDLAAPGRWAANATFTAPHQTDDATGVALAMDLGPLLDDPTLAPAAYVAELTRAFADEVGRRLGGGPSRS